MAIKNAIRVATELSEAHVNEKIDQELSAVAVGRARLAHPRKHKRTRMGKIAFLFPGQASQYPGMGRDLAEHFPESQAVFDEADAALGFQAICNFASQARKKR